MENIVQEPTHSRERLNEEGMSASRLIPELRKLQARLKVTLVSRPRSRQPRFIQSCVQKGCSVHTWPETPRGSLHKSSQIPAKRTTLEMLMGQHGEREADFVSLALSLLADQSDVLLQSRTQMVLDIHYPDSHRG